MYLLAPHTSGLSSERPAGRETDEQMSAGKSAGLAEEGHCVRGQSSWPHAEQRTGNIPGVTQHSVDLYLPVHAMYTQSVLVACVTKLDKKCISMRVPSLKWTLWSFAFENTLIIQISEIQVPVLIIVPLHQCNAEPYFNLAETFSECNKLSEMKNELTDTDMLFCTGDSGAAGTAPRRDVLHGGSTETVRDVWSLTDRAPAESCHRGGWGLGDKPLPPLKEGPQKGPMREAGSPSQKLQFVYEWRTLLITCYM